MKQLTLFLLLTTLLIQPLFAQDYHIEDAERFAKIFLANPDRISSDMLKSEYLNPGSRGVKIFTPQRIKNAKHMANMVSKYPKSYRKGVELMLPAARTSAEASAKVLAQIQELLQQKKSAPVYIVFGGNNSGGTASGNGLVIGLEVLGRFVNTEAEAKELIKSFVAHEVVHVYQSRSGNGGRGSLLSQSLREGFADFIENLALNGISSAEKERHEYGLANEAQLWSEFKEVMNKKELRPWMYGKGENDRPSDLGYWLGKRICEAYYNKAEDKAEALQILLKQKDIAEILVQSGYSPRG